MRLHSIRRLICPLLVAALLLAACAPAPGGGEAERTIEVATTDELRYEPASMTARAGETVRFVVHNDGRVVHEFLTGDEAQQAEYAAEMTDGHGDAHGPAAGISLGPGETGEFTYTFEEAGELLVGCHEPGHYEGGMVATIAVQP